MKSFQIITLSIFFCLLYSENSIAQIDPPEEGKGTVVFYRKKKFSGGAITFNIQDSERNYGPMKNGDVLSISVEPGTRTFFSQVLSADAITINVEEGRTYYVKAMVKVGFYAGRPKFEQVDEKTALKQIKE